MEGVEDIPGTALHLGLSWARSSFPEYLDGLATARLATSISAHSRGTAGGPASDHRRVLDSRVIVWPDRSDPIQTLVADVESGRHARTV